MAFIQDVKHAARTLLRERAVSAVIVSTLALGIAANAIVVGVVDQLLLQPPPGIGDAAAVRRVHFGADKPAKPGAPARVSPQTNYSFTVAISGGVQAFANAAAVYTTEVTLGAGAGARRATAELVNAAYFPLLKLAPAAGTFFTDADDGAPDGSPVVVLSHAFWRREFDADPAVVGRDLLVEGQRLTIIGVAPRDFSGVDRRRVDFWTPPGALGRRLLGDDWPTTLNLFRFRLLARLAPHATDAQANAQATAAYRRAIDAAPDFGGADTATASVAPLNGLGHPNGLITEAKVGLWLLGVAVVVLIIACANVANLLLARTISRRREIAVRVALGASRRRLLGQLMTESALLSAIAAATALALTYVCARLVQQLLLPGFVWNHGVVDERVLAITLGAAMLTTGVAGLAPALHALPDGVMHVMRPAQRLTRGGTGMLRTGLLVVQITLCTVLLIGAGLFVRSLAAGRAHDVGVDLNRVIEAALPPTLPREDSERLYALGMERLAAHPGVRHVALGGGSARLSRSSSRSMTPEGLTAADLQGRSMDAYFVVTPDYLAALGARIERGRDFASADQQRRARVAVVNRALADRFWPGRDPIGACVSFSIVFQRPTCTTIIGVVANTLLHNRLDTTMAQIFLLRSHPEFERERPTALVIRTADDAAPLLPAIRQLLQTLTPDMGYVEVNTLAAKVAPQLQPWRLGTAMFLVFGAVALVIAAVGIYSSMAFAVSQRTQEIGIRIALGATRWDITRGLGVSSAVSIVAGTGLGLLAAALASGWLVDVLFETSPHDRLVYVAVPSVLAFAGLAASVVPAHRASSVDPLVVLKAE